MQNPLEGNNIWIKMGIETGITNITSSTAVRIKFAYQCPFPNEKASEDKSFVDDVLVESDLELMPISKDESFRINYIPKTGIVLEFSR